MRPIDADAFKEYIKNGIDGLILPRDQVVKVIAITKSFLKDIDEQPTIEVRPRGEWIPLHFDSGSKCVSDFPNEMDGKLVIVTDGKRVSVERIKKDAYDHFFPYGTFFELEDVVAWMPLPEPYQK